MKRYLGIALALIVSSSLVASAWIGIRPPVRKKRPRTKAKPRSDRERHLALVPRAQPGSDPGRDRD